MFGLLEGLPLASLLKLPYPNPPPRLELCPDDELEPGVPFMTETRFLRVGIGIAIALLGGACVVADRELEASIDSDDDDDDAAVCLAMIAYRWLLEEVRYDGKIVDR